jgi:NADH-quinone oxidoreductase subunit J
MEKYFNPLIDGIFSYIGGFIDYIAEWLSPILPGAHWAAYLAFVLYVLIILGGGFLAVLSRNLVRAMMGLVLTFLGVAGMYLLLASPFLAFMQLLIYVGAVCVLIFFAVMLTHNSSEGEETKIPSLSALVYGALAFLAPLGVAVPLIIMHGSEIPNKVPEPTPTGALGEGLLKEYVLSFELISIVLLVAMAGAVYLAFRGFTHRKGENS